jgi:predicted Zn-ribbon and HTH transcriptional regulator
MYATSTVYEDADQERMIVPCMCKRCGDEFLATTPDASYCPKCRKIQNGRNRGGSKSG